jgi:hypothetical protein
MRHLDVRCKNPLSCLTSRTSISNTPRSGADSAIARAPTQKVHNGHLRAGIARPAGMGALREHAKVRIYCPPPPAGGRSCAKARRRHNMLTVDLPSCRIACLLFVLEALLDLIVGPRDGPEECPGFSMIPLPCPRYLWDYEHRDAWGYRIRQYMDQRGEDRALTIRNLLQARRPSPPPERHAGEKDGDRLVVEMARWCADIDEFGTLVWMAALLD